MVGSAEVGSTVGVLEGFLVGAVGFAVVGVAVVGTTVGVLDGFLVGVVGALVTATDMTHNHPINIIKKAANQLFSLDWIREERTLKRNEHDTIRSKFKLDKADWSLK